MKYPRRPREYGRRSAVWLLPCMIGGRLKACCHGQGLDSEP